MNAKIVSAELKAILNGYNYTCLCGHADTCEVCDKQSLFNKLKKEIGDYADKIKYEENYSGSKRERL